MMVNHSKLDRPRAQGILLKIGGKKDEKKRI